MIKPVRKIVFPVAGLGTRFLPASKAVPKVMLPVADKPVIQYAVEEAIAAGMEQIILVTGRGQGAIEDHFDHSFELSATLRDAGKTALLEDLERDLLEPGRVIVVRQQKPLGLGHAVWCARHIIGDEPFAVSLADVLTSPNSNALKQLVDGHAQVGGNVITLKEVPHAETFRYGIADIGESVGDLVRLAGMVEKPTPENAPSNLHILGRYILQPEIFGELEHGERGAGGEIQLTDAMVRLATKQDFYGSIYEGDFFDCGDKIGFLKASMAMALERPELRAELAPFIAKKLKEIGKF